MATYIGYYRIDEDSARARGANAREAGEPVLNPTMRRKVIDIRDKLPASIKLIGSCIHIGALTRTYPRVR